MDGAEGADPAAEDAAEDERRDDRDQGENERGVNEAGRDERDQGEQRVEVEEALDRGADIVLARVVGADEEDEEEPEETRLAHDPQDLKGPVFPRSFFFQRGASPARMSPGRAPGPASGRGAPGA